MIKCPMCNKELEDGTKFCDACGAEITQVAETPAEETAKASPLSKLPFKISKKLITIGCAVVAAVLVVSVLLSLITGAKEPNYALYMKEGEMYYTGISKIKPVEVTEDLDGSSSYAVLAKDGKTLFYNDGENGDTLYYRNINNPKKEPVKLDSDVSVKNVLFNEKYTLLTYLKDGTIYQHNLKDKTKLVGNASSLVRVSEDGKRIVYYERNDNEDETYTYDAFYKDGKKEAVKIDSDMSRIVYADEKLNTFYYIKEGTLYKKVGKKDKVKISSDVSSIVETYKNGAIYYTKANDTEEDNSEEENFGLSKKYTLCYYDGKVEKILTDSYSDYVASCPDYEGTPAIIFYTENTDGDEVKREYSLAYKDTVSAIDATDVYGFVISEDAKTIYFIGDAEEGVGTLYKMAISGEKAKKAEKYDEDVSTTRLTVLPNGKVMYFKEVKDSKGEMYVNKDKIDFDVATSGIYYKDNGTLVYKTDVSDEGTFTLKYAKGKKVVKVADDVYNFSITPGGDLLYLQDYNTEKYKGDLYLCKNGSKKSKKIDEDVSRIITVSSEN